MKFVLFRHAQKGIMPFEDPELSPKGFEQSLALVQLIKNNTLPSPNELLVSPKRRTSQSFYPISKEFTLNLKIKPELDQRLDSETAQDFRFRVRGFINDMSNRHSEDSVVFACTHYDVIEEAMAFIDCDQDLSTFEYAHWSPTQFVVFEIQPTHWKLIKKGSTK